MLPVTLVAVFASGCAASAASGAPIVGGPPAIPQASPGAPDARSRPATPDPPVSRAREGRTAASERIRFRPQELILRRGGKAAVDIATTVDGELQVPENVRHLGWWDGGAYANDPFGSTVIAGHVDSKTQGLGFFVRLLRAEKGDEITLRGDGHQLRYRVASVTTVTKLALAADSEAFDQTGDHRLVLITCTGDYDADRGGYDSNLVIYAKPIGAAT